MAAACKWKQIADIRPQGFIEWRCNQDIAPRTLNHYLDALNVFLRWLIECGRLTTNPVESIKKVDARGRATFHRRALTRDEAASLLAVDERRRPVYLLAMKTGLRRSEIGTLEWRDLLLDGEHVVVSVRAANTKNRRHAVLPLASDVSAALRKMRPNGVEPCERVFKGRMPNRTTVQRDFERAGIQRVDDQGRRVDFHALRNTCITWAGAAGVSEIERKELARHSDARLTANVYTDPAGLNLRKAVDSLPSFPDEPTDGASPIASRAVVPTCQAVAPTDTSKRGVDATQHLAKPKVSRNVARGDTEGHLSPKNWRRGESILRGTLSNRP